MGKVIPDEAAARIDAAKKKAEEDIKAMHKKEDAAEQGTLAEEATDAQPKKKRRKMST